MFKELSEAIEISFIASSEHPLFPLGKITIKKHKKNSFVVPIVTNDKLFHLQRPMNTKILNDDDVEFFGNKVGDHNPMEPNVKFRDIEHCLQYLDHYTGYHLLKSGKFKVKDSSFFLTDVECTYSVIISQLDENMNVVNEFCTPDDENCISIFLPEYLENRSKKNLVEIETNFGVIELDKSDIENAIDIEEHSYYFKEKGLLITTRKLFSC